MWPTLSKQRSAHSAVYKLNIRLLGGFAVASHNQTPLEFESDKARALLAYLIVESYQPHRRESLIGLLWPETNEARARRNLNQVVYSLRQVLQPLVGSSPLLLTDRHAVQLHPQAGLDVDVWQFLAAVERSQHHHHTSLAACASCRQALAQASALYRGEFLAGFSLGDCAAFEEWLLNQRECLAQTAAAALCELAICHERRGEFGIALEYARRHATLAPWQETAHRRVMRLLARLGQQAEALAHFERVRAILWREVGVEPGRRTVRLYHAIQEGRFSRPYTAPENTLSLPDFLLTPATAPHPSFVGRQAQLQQLHEWWAQTLAGRGCICCVTGEAGAGKTALMTRFAAEAASRNTQIFVVWGRGHVPAGDNESYLPFRQILSTLLGSIEVPHRSGVLDRSAAAILWAAVPANLRSLLRHAPDLIDALQLENEILAWLVDAEIDTAQQSDLRHLLGRRPSRAETAALPQIAESVVAYLRALTTEHPVLVLLDDMQWADDRSCELLFHLGQVASFQRLLIVCSYRQEEVEVERAGPRHPLLKPLAELQNLYGDITINLNRLTEQERRSFVEHLLDAEPNQLDASFRSQLFRRTEGHALFTAELLHNFQERGELHWEAGRGWVASERLDWERIPARAEGIIAERIGRLSPQLRGVLDVASIEGEVFAAQAVAHALGLGVLETLRCLDTLDRVHRLVREAGEIEAGGALLHRYRFRHSLFQQHVYHALSHAVRWELHHQLGTFLEAAICGDLATVDVGPRRGDPQDLGVDYSFEPLPTRALE